MRQETEQETKQKEVEKVSKVTYDLLKELTAKASKKETRIDNGIDNGFEFRLPIGDSDIVTINERKVKAKTKSITAEIDTKTIMAEMQKGRL